MTVGGQTWIYTNNADGLRTSKTNGAAAYQYIYDGSKLTQMVYGDHVLYFSYDATGAPLTLTHNGTLYYYVTNIQGDVIAITDDAGFTVVTYGYDAWGNLLSTGGSLANTLGILNPLRYRSYVYDTETQLYYLQSRYYDPQISRFLNADAFASTGQGLLGNNMFAYCGNNPGCRIDKSGMLWSEFWENTWNWVAEVYERSMSIQWQQQAVDIQIRQRQIDIISTGTKVACEVWQQSYRFQQEAQLENSMALIEGVKYFVDNPKQAEGVFRDMIGVSASVATIMGKVVTGTVVPGGAIAVCVLALWDMGWRIVEIVDKFE